MKKRIFVIITATLLFAALTLSSMAATFVPSIEGKLLPDILIDGLADQNREIVAQIQDGDVIIVPYSEHNSTDNPKAKEELEKSYKELKEADSLKEICPELDNIADSIIKGATAKDFSVTDVFFIDYKGNLPLSSQDGYLVLTVDLSKYSSKYNHTFMVKGSDGKWRALTGDDIVYNENGTTAYLKVTDLASTVAILQMNDNVIIKEEDPGTKSPQTGLMSNSNIAYIAAGCAVVLAAAVVVAVVVSKKKYQ